MKIEFSQLTYRASSGYNFNESVKKTILNGINGEFKSGELTAIMGPSGSGKTTLLNILSGFINGSKDIEGIIKINGVNYNSSTFKRNATYIMQEENLFPTLTVLEAMEFAVKFKIGNSLSRDECSKKIMKTLMTLGLEGKIDDFCGGLSGGQKKRLSIALELVDDPPVLFLDEPTTGLDSSSTTQCIRFLKKLAKEGRSVICTIHQPSSLVFEMFDLVYTLAEGQVIYQGTSQNLILFFKELGIPCPETYSPSDYLLEIANNDYGSMNNRLSRKINNGMNFEYRGSVNNCDENHNDTISPSKRETCQQRDRYALSFIDQFLQLMKRNLIFMRRDKFFYLLRIFVHIFVAIMMGLIYSEISQDASFIINIYRFSICAALFCAYAGFYSLIAKFPIERPTIKREHFNSWYSPTPYFLSLILSDVPVVVISSLFFTVISYIMTHQPMELFRFGSFILISATSSLVAQAHGILIGALFDLKTSLIAAALLTGAHALASGALYFFKDVPNFFRWIFDFVYLKHSVNASATVVLGFDRPKFQCSDLYCHFQSPGKFLQSIGLEEDLTRNFTNMFVTLIVVHFFSFIVMRYRLKN